MNKTAFQSPHVIYPPPYNQKAEALLEFNTLQIKIPLRQYFVKTLSTNHRSRESYPGLPVSYIHETRFGPISAGIAMNDEIFGTVDEAGRVTGLASREELHRSPSLIHRVVHVLVFDTHGRLLLQKRSMNKDVAPGKWDTSVGGHLHPGEDVLDAACREMQEELGVEPPALDFLYQYLFRNHRESELVATYRCVRNGPFSFNAAEIEEVRFWEVAEIRSRLGTGIFSEHFETEFRNYTDALLT